MTSKQAVTAIPSALPSPTRTARRVVWRILFLVAGLRTIGVEIYLSSIYPSLEFDRSVALTILPPAALWSLLNFGRIGLAVFFQRPARGGPSHPFSQFVSGWFSWSC